MSHLHKLALVALLQPEELAKQHLESASVVVWLLQCSATAEALLHGCLLWKPTLAEAQAAYPFLKKAQWLLREKAWTP